MKIHSTDYADIMDYMIGQRWVGNEFVAFLDDSGLVQKEELFCFATPYEAMEFCYEMSTDVDRYKYLPVRSVYRSMSEALQDKTLRIERGQLVDVAAMVSIYNQRLEEQQLINNQKQNVMNEKNYDYLKDQIKFTGFGEGLENELRDKMQKQTPDFQIAYKAKFGNDELNAVLHFKKSDETDMYFFNRYQVSLKPEQSSETMEQTFYINKGNNVTLKEAFNLMNGRAVNKDLTNKEGDVYNTWLQMDFKQTDNNGNYKMKHFHQNYGYDLDSVLAKHPITELLNEKDKTRLVESLQKGNRQSVTIVQGNSEKKQFIEANPQFKTINFYDGNMQRISHKQVQNEKQGQGEQNSVKQNAKNENQKQGGDADDGDAVPKASNKRKKKQSHSVS